MNNLNIDNNDDSKNKSNKMLLEKSDLIKALKTVYDPEIPVDIYELGLIYDVDLKENGNVDVKMTLTAPGCPVAGEMPQWVENAIMAVEGVEKVVVDIDAFEKCINRALRYGRKGWKEVKEGNAINVLVRQRQSVGLRLKNLLANWAKEGAAALGDVHLPALDRAVANAHKLNLGNIERYHPLISQAMSIQLSARERQNIRD